MRLFLIPLPVLMSVAVVACKSGDIGAPQPAAQSQSGPKTDLGQGAGTGRGTADSVIVGTQPSLVSLTMNMTVTVAGIQLCTGVAHLKLNIKLTADDKAFKLLELPDSLLDCGIQKVDLTKLLQGLDDKQPPQVDHPLYVQSNVIHARVLGQDLYDPGRPLVPALFTADPNALKTVNYGLDATLKSSDGTQTGTGHFTARTALFTPQLSYAPLNRSFQKVYDFEMTSSGFDGLDKLNHFLFDRMALRLALAPVALLSLDLDTKVSDILQVIRNGAGTGTDQTAAPAQPAPPNILGAIVGIIGKLITVAVHGDTTQIDGLDQGTPTGDDGEVIGGKPVATP